MATKLVIGDSGTVTLNIFDAADAVQRATDWASKAEDSEVISGEYSAKHWAAKAASSAATIPNVGDAGDVLITNVAGTARVNVPIQVDDGVTVNVNDTRILLGVDGVLEDLDTLGAPTLDGQFIVATGSGVFAYESGATVRTSLELGNVENTALSTWAGSSNITTLGTIATGVWEGTTIADGQFDKTGDWTGTFDGQNGSFYQARANHTGTQIASTISDFSEAVDDRVSVLIQDGTGISWSYDDVANTLTPTISLSAFSTTNLSEGSNLYFTNERVDDRVNALLVEGTDITLTYDDGAGTLTIDSTGGITNNTSTNSVPYWDGDSFEDSNVAYNAGSSVLTIGDANDYFTLGRDATDHFMTGFVGGEQYLGIEEDNGGNRIKFSLDTFNNLSTPKDLTFALTGKTSQTENLLTITAGTGTGKIEHHFRYSGTIGSKKTWKHNGIASLKAFWWAFENGTGYWITDDMGAFYVAADETTDNDSTDAPSLTFRATYDSDPSASVTSADFDAVITHIMTVAGSSPESYLDITINSNSIVKFTSTFTFMFGSTTERDWESGARAIQLDDLGVIYQDTGNAVVLARNVYFNAGEKYIASGEEASILEFAANGTIRLRSSGTGTAGNNITLITGWTVDTVGNFIVGAGAVATSATDGFLYIPTCAGVPTGNPTSHTGRLPIVYDSTNDDLYIYDGGWISVALT